MKKILVGCVVIMGIYWLFNGKKQEIKNFPNAHRVIVAFGDSLTTGYGAADGKSYPAQLAQYMNRPVVNLGKNGEMAVQAAERLPQVLKEHPYMVLIEFGANDFMRQQSTQAAVKAVEQLVDAVQEAGAIAVIVDTGGPGMGEYTKAYKKIARQKGALYVPPILKGIFYKPHLKSDAVHPNSDGYALVAKKVYKVINPYL